MKVCSLVMNSLYQAKQSGAATANRATAKTRAKKTQNIANMRPLTYCQFAIAHRKLRLSEGKESLHALPSSSSFVKQNLSCFFHSGMAEMIKHAIY